MASSARPGRARRPRRRARGRGEDDPVNADGHRQALATTCARLGDLAAGRKVHLVVESPDRVGLPANVGDELRITLDGTLRNLPGPHHHPAGELPVVPPPLFEHGWDADPHALPAEAVEAWDAASTGRRAGTSDAAPSASATLAGLR